MGIVGKRVEENIRKLQAGHVLVQVRAAGENQPVRIDPAYLGLTAQVGSRRIAGVPQPQHAASNLAEQPHPDVEQRRRELPALVEAAKYDACFGQAGIMAHKRRGHRPPIVLHEVTAGQMNDCLAIGRLVGEWRHHGIGEDVIHAGRSAGGGIPQIIDLNRRCPVGEYPWPSVLGVAIQIDRNVDLARAH